MIASRRFSYEKKNFLPVFVKREAELGPRPEAELPIGGFPKYKGAFTASDF